MRIDLDLTKHCVETEIKRVYHRALSSYFKPGADTAHLERIIALTQQALEHLDFAYLRGHYPPLAGHSDVPVALGEEDDRPTILIDGSAIAFVEKKTSVRK
jgi:hypothetical protein